MALLAISGARGLDEAFAERYWPTFTPAISTAYEAVGTAYAIRRRRSLRSRNHGPPPRLSKAELPAVTPPEIIGVRGADGQRGLDLRDGEYERVYGLPDPYTRLMFIALCRQEGVLVYRRPRQRNETLCVKITAWKHRGLEQRFEELSALLDGELVAVAQRFLAEHFEVSGR